MVFVLVKIDDIQSVYFRSECMDCPPVFFFSQDSNLVDVELPIFSYEFQLMSLYSFVFDGQFKENLKYLITAVDFVSSSRIKARLIN